MRKAAYILAERAKRKDQGIGRTDKWNELRKEFQAYPSVDTHDPHYRRLLYVRYADDYLLGFAGPKAEAMEIKERIRRFLQEKLSLEQAEEKTLITHAAKQRARFLGYEIGIKYNQTKMDRTKRRTLNGKVMFYIPSCVIDDKVKRYLRRGKPIHRAELTRDSEFDIIYRYQWEYRGLVEYYAMAQNLTSLGKLRYVMEVSLLKTLANKGRTTVAKTYKRLASKKQTPHGPRACLKLVISREGKRPLVAEFGGISLVRQRTANIKEHSIRPYIHARSEVVDRLLNDTCEICKAIGDVEVHHIRKLSDLRKPGRKEKPLWMRIMAARNRKTLVVCRVCHMNIQWNRQENG
jgi:hypothetical protein